VTAKLDARIRRLFPFELTDGQNRAVQEITADLAANHAMHRLLQADVGAGKTAIALYAVLVAVAAGSQAVLMAPTEVLARQHWDTVERALSHSRVNRLLLTGHLTAKQRGRALKQISDGTAQLIVGTQAVIQKDVVFHKLGLVVIDEQHKFGVEQRARFSAGETSPHVLVMTATPIPRSLSMTQFGDLEITTISELPPGRQPVVTSRATAEGARKRVWGFLRKQLRAGRQAYVICPRIEADRSGNENQPEPEIDPDREIDPDDIVATEFSEESTVDHSTGSESTGAEHVFRQLQAEELKDFRVGLVHGQLEREQKAVAMDAFRAGETQVLVSTTVVEIGVDVPNATLMVILGAERFGLSQLHQLRGRTARGQFQGYCFLFSDADGPDAARRLHAMETLSDGFRIAETDFELRGPGDVLGTRQHGLLPLKVANLTRDGEILEESRTIAFDLVNSGEFDRPHFAPLKIEVLERFGRLMDLHHTG
jgi:ATP-dependent DNA helicase RecG